MIKDPWKNLEPPLAAESISAQRVDEHIRWDFFWARGIDKKCMLVLKYAKGGMPLGRLPKLKGLDIAISPGVERGFDMLIFKLLDSSHRDIFHKLCMDIVAGAKDSKTEKEALSTAIARTWRWHHLLRGGTDERLSPEAQKGLIGELFVLEQHLLPIFQPEDAVAAWHGPLGAPKDFEISRVCIESKARRGAAAPYIAISSEHQLDDSGTDFLFVHVVELDRAPSDSKDGFTVTSAAERVRAKISAGNGSADVFDGLLLAMGFKFEDDYSDTLWVDGPCSLYQVTSGFPRVVASDIVGGVSQVKYSVSLVECAPFLVAADVLELALKGNRHGK